MNRNRLTPSQRRGRPLFGTTSPVVSDRDERLCIASCRDRKGAFTVVVLVCLLISTMLLASLLKLALLHDNQSGHVLMRLQTTWLAESGLDRAAARLASDPDYAGETWTINADRLGGLDGAAVVIRVRTDDSQTDRRLVEVEAAYPAEGTPQARLTRQTTITLAQEK